MPTISSVTGTVSTGQVLTISGSSLLNESLTGIDSFFSDTDNSFGTKRQNFDGSDGTGVESYTTRAGGPQNLGWIGHNSGSEETETAPGFIDTSFFLRGTGSAKYRSIENNHPGAPTTGTGQSYDNGSLRSLSTPHEYWGRANFAIQGVGALSLNGEKFPNYYSKLIYNNASHYINFEGVGVGNESLAFNQLNLVHPTTHGGGTVNHARNILADGSRLVDQRWYCIEWHWKRSVGPTADGIFEVYVNRRSVYSATSGESNSMVPLSIGTINAAPTSSANPTNVGWDFRTWFDDVLTKPGNTRVYPTTTIEISDNSTYGAGTLVWQHQKFISDTSVQVECDLTGLGAGPYYLFVTDHQQNVSSAYNLSGSLPSPSGGLPALVFL